MTETPPETQIPDDPLEIANNLVAAVRGLAQQTTRDPMEAAIRGFPARVVAAAEQARRLATVSIARDLRRIADHLTGTAVRVEPEPDVLTEALLVEARRHSTDYLRDTYARGERFGHPWPPLKAAIEQVLAERGEPIPTTTTPEEG
ncbi:hypothetical protein [Streptosporangium sp. NPDC020145]|uniref:hypothetical protein n=1 Tax=Streptosporangium sp. NPDC020145 TaxID=3154694 RepID=UPI00343DD2FE